MEMYNSKRKLTELEGYYYINEGSCARIFKKNNEAFKLYKFDTKYYYFLGKKMFKAIKELDIPNIVKLHDYYYYYDDYISRHLQMDGYSMEYVEEDKTLVIDKPSDYLFSIADDFDKTIEILTDNKILIRDPHHGNIIFGKDKATLIDLDTYEFCKFATYDELKKENQKAILDFLSSQIIYEFNDEDDLKNYFLVSTELHHLLPNINKPIRKILEKVIDEDTPRKSINKRKRLY